MVGRRIGFAAVVALLLALTMTGPASAHVVTKQKNPHGVYYVVDFQTQGGGQCGYGAENSSGQAYLKWMWFLKPEVYARNTTSNRDHQTVRLTYTLQHRKTGSQTKWTTVATKQQSKTAWDDTRADFKSQTLYAPARSTQVWRGLVNIKWIRNGSMEGQVSYLIEWYSASWTVGAPDYMFNPWCDGVAD
jgi:hypothetical protein